MCASCLTSKLLVYIKAHHHTYVFSIDFTSCESNWSSRWAIGTSLLARREFRNPKENSCKQPSYASQINNITNLNDNTVHMCFLNYYSLKVPVDGTLGREWRREFTLAHNTGGPWKPLTTKNTLTLAFINGSRRPNQPMHGRWLWTASSRSFRICPPWRLNRNPPGDTIGVRGGGPWKGPHFLVVPTS